MCPFDDRQNAPPTRLLPANAPQGLTRHEQRLLKLLVEGHSYKTAAVALEVSVSTINFHIQNIYGKLQVHSKSEAVAKALRHRLVSRIHDVPMRFIRGFRTAKVLQCPRPDYEGSHEK